MAALPIMEQLPHHILLAMLIRASEIKFPISHLGISKRVISVNHLGCRQAVNACRTV
jgi:hypothetical protein